MNLQTRQTYHEGLFRVRTLYNAYSRNIQTYHFRVLKQNGYKQKHCSVLDITFNTKVFRKKKDTCEI